MAYSEKEFIKQLENSEKQIFSLKSQTLNSKAVSKANEIIKQIQQTSQENINKNNIK